MVQLYYGSTEYLEREVEKEELARKALIVYVAANFQENSKEFSESADKVAMVAEALERADSRVRHAKRELEEHLAKKAKEEAEAKAEEGDE